MTQNKFILSFMLLSFLFNSCIEPYDYLIGGEPKFVVLGRVTNEEGYQTVSVSLSSEIQTNKYTDQIESPPVTDCLVKIFDDKGNEFLLDEFQDGKYRVWMDQVYLTPGTSYKVEVETSTGVKIVSDFDSMMECPDVDSVYYDVFSDVNKPSQGVQFYIDFNGSNTNCQFVKWEIEETWEYHSYFPIQDYILNGQFIHSSPPDFSHYYCWNTLPIKNIFVLSTKNLTQNTYNKFPLHFAKNKISRFEYCYSLLAKQYSLSGAAYKYWDELKTNNTEQGSLYDTQPIVVKGNLHNVTSPEQDVLGFFYTSAVTSKRIFVTGIYLYNEDDFACEPVVVDDVSSFEVGGPYYVKLIEKVLLYPPTCVDCFLRGGTNTKPDYWPY